LKELLLVMLGGSLGAALRYALKLGIESSGYQGFYATLGCNVLGCFVFGILSGWFLERQMDAYALFALVGLLGSFTTFSAFSGDFFYLYSESIQNAILYATVTTLGSLGSFPIGTYFYTLISR
jgi:fluoride exporter